MSYPKSKFINKISYTDMSFLTDNNTYANVISGSDFNLTTGKPLNNNYTNSIIDPFFLNNVAI